MTHTESLDNIIEGIAILMAQPICEHQDFFTRLATALHQRGYYISAHQRGVHGTELKIVKRPSFG